MKERFFFRVGDEFTCMDENGFVAHESYMVLMKNSGMYFLEPGIIEKINANEEGFFDFSKALLDIGCEIGEYSHWTNFAYYYMFDGNRDKMTVANFNMLIRGKAEITETHVALLSDRNGYTTYDGFMGDELAGTVTNPGEVKTVETVTLDSFNIENLGLIKIDVEGMEEKVLRGGVGTIIRNDYPPILFELWDAGTKNMPAEKHQRLVKFLQGLGYEIIWNWGDEQTHLAIKKYTITI